MVQRQRVGRNPPLAIARAEKAVQDGTGDRNAQSENHRVHRDVGRRSERIVGAKRRSTRVWASLNVGRRSGASCAEGSVPLRRDMPGSAAVPCPGASAAKGRSSGRSCIPVGVAALAGNRSAAECRTCGGERSMDDAERRGTDAAEGLRRAARRVAVSNGRPSAGGVTKHGAECMGPRCGGALSPALSYEGSRGRRSAMR